MSPARAPQLIESADALDSLLQGAAAHGWLAVDTEFMRTNTYFPVLCLVQLAAGERVYCIDALALPDLTACHEFLADPARTKIFHAARQDLEVLNLRLQRSYRPLFDTQIAAALVGHPDQVSYAWLVEHYCGVVLDKSQTRTDWSRRPLSPEQLQYAGLDVRYLGEVRFHLTAALQAQGKLAWLMEECERLETVAAAGVPPDQAWRRVKGLGQLGAESFALGCALAAWRERLAQAVDRPRAWVLRDEALLVLARARPRKLAALAELDCLGAGFVRRHGDGIIELVAAHAPAADPAELPARLSPAGVKLLGELQALVLERAEAAGVVATLIASRKELEQAILGDTQLRFREGWRAALVGAAVEERLAATDRERCIIRNQGP